MVDVTALAMGVVAIGVTCGLAALGLAMGYGELRARVAALEERNRRHDSYIRELATQSAEAEGHRKAYESIHEE